MKSNEDLCFLIFPRNGLRVLLFSWLHEEEWAPFLEDPLFGQILWGAPITRSLQYLSLPWVQMDFQTRGVLTLLTLGESYVFYKLWKSLSYLYLECSKAHGTRHCLLLIRTAILQRGWSCTSLKEDGQKASDAKLPNSSATTDFSGISLHVSWK